MTEHDRHFDGVDRHVSPQFRKDLRALFEPPGAVPQEVDKTITDLAGACLRGRKHVTPRRLIIPVRWAAVATAAAVIVLGTILYTTVTHDTPQSAIRIPQSTAPGRADIDSNGRVDILDAFRLARHVESRGQTQTQWDLNGDGLVDRKDVDLVAFAAVRLGSGPQARRGEGILPLRREAILASLLPGCDASLTSPEEQGRDALATNPPAGRRDKGV